MVTSPIICRGRLAVGTFLGVCSISFSSWGKEDTFTAIRQEFVKQHCYECHDTEMEEGGLDLETMQFNLEDPRNFEKWVTVHDRVKKGEMPPKDKLSDAVVADFTVALAEVLKAADQAKIKREGRTVVRRLNRHEYENALKDLLHTPWLRVADMLPEDGVSHGFNRSGESLDISHVHMARYLDAADYALRAVMMKQLERPEKTSKRYYASDEERFVRPMNLGGPAMRRPFPVIGSGPDPRFLELYKDLSQRIKGSERKHKYSKRKIDPKYREEEGIGLAMSTYEPTEIRFGSFKAPVTGRYRIRLKAHTIWVGGIAHWVDPNSNMYGPQYEKLGDARIFPNFSEISRGRRSEPLTIYADRPPRQLRKLAMFDVYPEPSVEDLVVTLYKGETIRPDAARLFRLRGANVINPLASEEGMPAVCYRWLEVEGPLVEEWPPAGQKVLFGDLPVVEGKNGRLEVVSENPYRDAKRLMRDFLNRAYGHPVEEADFELFMGMIEQSLNKGESFTEAMLVGYKAVLCSPRFIYFEQGGGLLNDWELAFRLSYFLWNSPPDEELRELARTERLGKSKVLRNQVERLLNHEKADRFVKAFLDYWLDLKNIADTAPDGSLYPDYQLDDLLVESMVEESQAFFKVLLDGNLSASNLIDSDFVMINERLATHYEIEHVRGAKVRKVNLLADDLRGGFMTQASVLKVTANGNNTSPILRGVWVMERLLGEKIPPPPENVPAVEPDTRGAVTIRELLEKHKNDKTCASCHKKIDPYGFALEEFDVMGGKQEYYRAIGGTPIRGGGHNGRPFEFHYAQKSETHGKLLGSGDFKDVRELKRLLTKDTRRIAKGIAGHLIMYSTGSPVRFSDREMVLQILDRSADSNYGVRTLIHEIVQSELFQSK